MDRELELLLQEITSTLGGLSAVDAQATPATQPEKWSIQQIMEHLQLTYATTVQVLESRIEKGRPTLARPTLPQRIAKLLLLTIGYIPHGRKAPAHATPSIPATIRTGDELAARAAACLARIDQLTLRGEQVFGPQPAVSHAALGPLTMSQWRRFHLIHGRHHLKQIRAIRQSHLP